MKTVVLTIAIASVMLSGLTAFAEGTCASGDGNQHGAGPVAPYEPVASDPYYSDTTTPSNYATALEAGAAISSVVGSQPAPRARLTVVDSAPQSGSGGLRAVSSVLTARLTVVADAPREVLKPATEAVADAVAKVAPELSKKTEEAIANEDNTTIDEAIKGLVGTWTAVARHGDGELTTVELQLDDRGWAKLTLPGADGKPSTTKRRVEFKDEELKLTGPDAELSLGKLINFNSRQMVLARADGQITFVRP